MVIIRSAIIAAQQETQESQQSYTDNNPHRPRLYAACGCAIIVIIVIIFFLIAIQTGTPKSRTSKNSTIPWKSVKVAGLITALRKQAAARSRIPTFSGIRRVKIKQDQKRMVDGSAMRQSILRCICQCKATTNCKFSSEKLHNSSVSGIQLSLKRNLT